MNVLAGENERFIADHLVIDRIDTKRIIFVVSVKTNQQSLVSRLFYHGNEAKSRVKSELNEAFVGRLVSNQRRFSHFDAFQGNPVKLNSTVTKKSRPKPSSKINVAKILKDFACFLLVVNVLLFIAYNNMEAVDVPQDSFTLIIIKYGLYLSAFFQMLCICCIIAVVPKSYTKTSGSIWKFLAIVSATVWIHVWFSYKSLYECVFRGKTMTCAPEIQWLMTHRSVHIIEAANRIKRSAAEFQRIFILGRCQWYNHYLHLTPPSQLSFFSRLSIYISINMHRANHRAATQNQTNISNATVQIHDFSNHI